MLKSRPATKDEILAYWDFKSALKNSGRVRYRGFVRERAMRTAKNGVQHVEYFRDKAVLDSAGEPCIKTKQGVEPLTATIIILESGRETLVDLRIKSEYLK